MGEPSGYKCCRHCTGPWKFGHSSPCEKGCKPIPMTEQEYDLLMIAEDGATGSADE